MAGLRRVDELDAADRGVLIGVLEGLRNVRSRSDLVEIAIGRLLASKSPTPEKDLASSANRELRHGSKVFNRAQMLAKVPALAAALRKGDLSGEHVDVFSKVLGALEAAAKAELIGRGEGLVRAATTAESTPDEFALQLNAEARRIAADGGMSNFERQRRATRVRTWTDRASGMWRISGSFDPLTGATLHGRLQAAMGAMFAKRVPSTTPTDPSEKQDHLRALALIALTGGLARSFDAEASESGGGVGCEVEGDVQGDVDGEARFETSSGGDANETERADQPHAESCDVEPGADVDQSSDVDWSAFFGTSLPRFGRPELVIVIDTADLDEFGFPTVDFGIPVNIPWPTTKRLVGRVKQSSTSTVIVENGTIVFATGELNLGRTQRLANRAQRRALQALYATCCVPGCAVRYENTRLHHIIYWENGGLTDLCNLVPVCSRHHHLVHGGGWKLVLGPNRELTIKYPNGKTMTTGPPSRKAAA